MSPYFVLGTQEHSAIFHSRSLAAGGLTSKYGFYPRAC